MNTFFKIFCAAVILSSITACKTTRLSEGGTATAEASNTGVVNRYWKLIEINNQQVVMGEKMRREPHLELTSAETRVTGTGGCNIFNGTYTIEAPNRLAFSAMVATRMACVDMGVEAAMLKMLEQVERYSLSADGKFLVLQGAETTPLARFEAMGAL